MKDEKLDLTIRRFMMPTLLRHPRIAGTTNKMKTAQAKAKERSLLTFRPFRWKCGCQQGDSTAQSTKRNSREAIVQGIVQYDSCTVRLRVGSARSQS
eukprot:1185818-Prorocentrum_minimum.AAC.5